MNREFGPATIYVGDKVIGECKIESMNIEQEVHDYEEVKVNYEGELTFGINDDTISEYITHGWIGTRDERIKTNLGRVAKRVTIPADVYSNISHSLDKIERTGVRK